MSISFNVILELCIIAFVAGYATYTFIVAPKDKKIANVKEWLKYAVTVAEKDLGSGTGQLKLRQVCNMAVTQFPWIVQLVSFETFSGWVDEALEWMNKQLSENKAVQIFVEKE